jgi:hypothetical protein
MRIVEDDMFEDRSTGHRYRVKKIEEEVVVLEAEDGTTRVYLSKGSVELFFEKVEKEEKEASYFSISQISTLKN